jgi:hypothetical protein
MRKELLLSMMASVLVCTGHLQAQAKAARKGPPATVPAAAGAPNAPSSSELLKAAITVFKDSIDRKNSLLVAGNALFIDRDDLDVHLQPLGFARDYPGGNPVVKGLTFTVRSWNDLRKCHGSGAAESCTLPPRTVIVRFLNARWSVKNEEVVVLMGAYRRSEVDFNNPQLGGSVATLFFKRRGGQWVLSNMGKVVSS